MSEPDPIARTLSTHRVDVVPVVLERHPAADSLSIVKVFDYTCCVRTSDWEGKTTGAWIPPDSLVPNTPEYAFLKGHLRIRAKRLRGILSYGMLVQAPPGANVGDDVAEQLGITHYEPPLDNAGLKTGGEAIRGPGGFRPKYDVDSFQRYARQILVLGETLWITEKLHGANSRFLFESGQLWAGSRTEWKRQDPEILWWKALDQIPALQRFLQDHPGITVYGEVYGRVQSLRYGTAPGEIRFAAFDLLDGSRWLDPQEARNLAPDIPWVPVISAACPYDHDAVLALAEGISLIAGANHIREGIVVRPLRERTCSEIGRVTLKAVNPQYYETDK